MVLSDMSPNLLVEKLKNSTKLGNRCWELLTPSLLEKRPFIMVTWSTDCAAQSTIFLSLPLVWEVVELDGF